MRVLVGAITSPRVDHRGALALDWYRRSFSDVAGDTEKIATNLRNVHLCVVGRTCAASPLTPLPGMFATLAHRNAVVEPRRCSRRSRHRAGVV